MSSPSDSSLLDSSPSDSSPSTSTHLSTINIITFNILAYDYCRVNQFSYVNTEYIKYKYRLNLLSNIYKNSNLDNTILCLQEIDKVEDHVLLLKENGFTNVYLKRSGIKNDGLLIAYKDFGFIERYDIYYDDIIEKYPLLKDRLKRDNIGLIIILKQNNQIFIVCNTHLYWNPRYEDVKILQMNYLFNKVDEIYKKYNNPKLILCGDFNSFPNSELYNFIANNKINIPSFNTSCKLYLDSDLIKVAKYLRALGIDAYCPPSSSRLSVKELFLDVELKKRVLITRSRQVTSRKESPIHLFLPDCDVKSNLLNILKTFGFDIIADRVYSRCVDCNGLFYTVKKEDYKNMDVPLQLREGYDKDGNQLTFFECGLCKKVYWWGSATNKGVGKLLTMFDINTPEYNILDKLLKDRMYLDSEPIVTSTIPFGPTSTSDAKTEIKFDIPSEPVDIESVDTLNISVVEIVDDEDDIGITDIVPGNDGLWRLSSLSTSLSHLFNLKSAYYNINGVEPETTNVTKNFSGTLDYIFVNENLTVESVSPLLSLAECRIEDGLPNSTWPSDHLLLSARISYKNNNIF